MAAMTHTGPIGIDQINVDLYVQNQGEFSTVQMAVDYARVNLPFQIAQVVVVHGHDAADNIAAVTGGNVNTRILDQRNEANQRWEWNGSNYVPSDFVQLKGYIIKAVPTIPSASAAFYYDPQGTSGVGTGNVVASANPGKGMPSFQIKCTPGDGGAQWTYLRCDLDPAGNRRIQIPNDV